MYSVGSWNVGKADGGTAGPLTEAFVQWWFRVAVTPLMHRDERVNPLHGDGLSTMWSFATRDIGRDTTGSITAAELLSQIFTQCLETYFNKIQLSFDYKPMLIITYDNTSQYYTINIIIINA